MTNKQNNDLQELARQEFCYLTTTGRISGRPHQIEIWFVVQGDSVYMMAGNHGSDWVKNLQKDPKVTVRIANRNLTGTGRLVTDEQEETSVRNKMADKYNEREADGSLSEWAQTALPVAIDVWKGE